jgi:nucleoside-diphosphate-sugar epimerase
LGYKFNSRTQGYIQIKYNAQINVPKDENEAGEFGTVTNIVSNKINLLTHKEGSPRFNLTNQDNLISNEEMQKILEDAHPLVFGDKLIEFLEIVKVAVGNHNHKYPGLTPHSEGQSEAAIAIQNMNEYDLAQILSKNIRIN